MPYKLSENQVSTSLNDETVILNHSKGTYYNLNELGTFLWKSIEESPKTLQMLVEEILHNFDIDETTCKSDVIELLDELLNEKLIEKV